MTEKEDKDKIIPILIFLGLGGLAAWLFRRKIQPDKAILFGIVTNTANEPIPNVFVNCNGYTGQTDATGAYTIINIPPGSYSVAFTDPSSRYAGITIPVELISGSTELNIELLLMRIPVIKKAAYMKTETVYMGDDGDYVWLQAWGAEQGTLGAQSFPAGWWNPPWPNVGVRRTILFFDTTGIEQQPMSLYLFNAKSGSGCYFGSGDYYILSGNGANPNFGPEIYGWMRSRFYDSYFIASKSLSDIDCQQWGVFDIPAQFINPAGYTVLICVLADDFHCVSTQSGQHGSYLQTGSAYLTPIGG
jgi:hypothetical protein